MKESIRIMLKLEFFFYFREMNINYLWVFFFFWNYNSVASGELKILPSVLTWCSHCFINGENDLSCITVSFVSCQQMCSILVPIHRQSFGIFFGLSLYYSYLNRVSIKFVTAWWTFSYIVLFFIYVYMVDIFSNNLK